MVTNSGFGQIMEEGDNPGFFKILRREDLSCELMRMIPHDCIRSISDEEFSFKMTLKVPWGTSWPIRISKNPDFHYMEYCGWNKFVSDNCLGENEYLTFIHEADMCFKVNIYQVDGTEMLKPRKSAPSSSYGRNIYQEVKEEVDSSSESSYLVRKTAKSTEGRLRQERELSLGKKKAEETEKSNKKKKVCTDSEAGTSSLVPEFSLTIKKSHLLFLGVPKKFVVHMPKETTTFKIKHQKGKKSWEVLYLVTDAQTRFSAGWSRLAKYLDLEVGDVCTFKLIKPTKMLLQVETP